MGRVDLSCSHDLGRNVHDRTGDRRGVPGPQPGSHGTTHVFFIDAVLRRTLIELGTLGVQRVLGHSEKAVAYMADGYARIAGRPGICFAQSVGAANLASGLQDAYLGRAPVIAMTGHKQPSMQHRNAYQEIPHAPLFAPVTKFSARVDQADDLPRLMRQAWREAMTGTPRPPTST